MEEKYYLIGPAEKRTLVVGELKIGRSRRSDIVVGDPLASRHHATVWVENGKLLIRDEGAVNGTQVNGVAIHETVWLSDQDAIQIGDQIIIVDAPEEEGRTVMRGEDGLPVSTPVPSPILVAPPQSSQNSEQPGKKKGGLKIAGIGVGVIAIGCLCIAVVAAVYFFVVRDGNFDLGGGNNGNGGSSNVTAEGGGEGDGSAQFDTRGVAVVAA